MTRRATATRTSLATGYRRQCGTFAAGLLVLLAAAVPSAAAPPWEPYRESPMACDCDAPWQVGFGSGGRALAISSSYRHTPGLAARAADGTWTRREAPRVGEAIMGVHAGRALLIGARWSESQFAEIRLASGTIDGRFGKPRALGEGNRPRLAVDPSSGAALAVWMRRDGSLMALHSGPRRGSGWRFSRPFRIGIDRSGYHPIAVAVNRRGEAVVMWRASNRRTYLTPVDRNGRLRKRIELGRTGGTDNYTVDIADDGDWHAAWQTEHVFKGGGSTGRTVGSFTGSVRSRRVVRSQLDSYQTYGSIVPNDIHARFDSLGRPLLAWSSMELASGPTSGAWMVVRYSIGDAVVLGPSNTIRRGDRHAVLADLETGDDGRAVLLWESRPASGQPELFARYRTPGGQLLGGDEQIAELQGRASAAFDPVSEDPLAVWGSLRESFRR